ncbi:MAG: 30S ribosomal protein S6 [Candidatus Berkelbacteria bacterium]|nr:30S ribosomal protein S6 [Candidatus Berkelbacteria bacterium]
MLYSILLILKKQTDSQALPEIKKYIEEKKGKILSINEQGDARLNPRKKVSESNIVKLEIEINPKEVEKIKKKINHEKEIVSYILEKKKIVKKVKKEIKERKKPRKAGSGSGKKKRETGKAEKVLDSMQEEEKKIKDLDSTLDKILNE